MRVLCPACQTYADLGRQLWLGRSDLRVTCPACSVWLVLKRDHGRVWPTLDQSPPMVPDVPDVPGVADDGGGRAGAEAPDPTTVEASLGRDLDAPPGFWPTAAPVPEGPHDGWGRDPGLLDDVQFDLPPLSRGPQDPRRAQFQAVLRDMSLMFRIDTEQRHRKRAVFLWVGAVALVVAGGWAVWWRWG